MSMPRRYCPWSFEHCPRPFEILPMAVHASIRTSCRPWHPGCGQAAPKNLQDVAKMHPRAVRRLPRAKMRPKSGPRTIQNGACLLSRALGRKSEEVLAKSMKQFEFVRGSIQALGELCWKFEVRHLITILFTYVQHVIYMFARIENVDDN